MTVDLLSIAQQFADHLRDEVNPSGGVFVSKLPGKPNSASDQWAVIAFGGSAPTGGNFLVWRQPITLEVRYRHRSTAEVYAASSPLVSAAASFIPLETTQIAPPVIVPMVDIDEDAEGRHVASWQVQLVISIK